MEGEARALPHDAFRHNCSTQHLRELLNHGKP